MRKFKLFLAVLLLVFSVPLVFAGGGGQKDAEPASSQALSAGARSMEKFTLTYFDAFGDPELYTPETKAFHDNVAKLFKTLYPNATLELTGVSAGRNGLDILQMQLQSGTGPDVFTYNNRIVPFAQAGYLYDLSDQPWTKDVVEADYPEVKYNGKFYGAPNQNAGWGIIYNKTIYEDQLGLKPPKNFQEFLDACEKIKKAGYDPLITGGAEGWPFYGVQNTFMSFIFGANKNFPVDLYTGKAKLNGPEIKAMYDAVKTIHDKGYFSPASMSTSHEGAIQYLGEKKAVMTFLVPAMAGPLEDPSSYNMTLGFFYVPDWNGYNCISVTADTSYAVNAKSKYASTAGVDLISCLIDESSLHLLNDNSGPVGYKSKTMRFDNLSGKMYQEALTKGPVVMQISSWLPESANLGVEIISSIFTGKGYSPQMLDEMQKNYDADKSLVNFSAFSD